MTGKFITLEGGEGAGKSTAMRYMQSYLKDKQIDFVTTREPGGTDVSEEIRQVLLRHHDETITPETETLLMFATRAQNLSHVVRPALARGQWVLCDRFVDASYAYQGGGRAVPVDFLDQLSRYIVQDTMPDMTLLLDIPVDIGMKRISRRNTKDRIEIEQVAFFERVRAAYLDRAKACPDRFRVIDAAPSIQAVQAQIADTLNELFV